MLNSVEPLRTSLSPAVLSVTDGRRDGETTKKLLDTERITFVSCIGSRQETMGCSRYCSTSMIGQALRLRQMGKKVRVLYRDMRTYSRHAEEFYEEAMRAGVQFFRHDCPQEDDNLRPAS